MSPQVSLGHQPQFCYWKEWNVQQCLSWSSNSVSWKWQRAQWMLWIMAVDWFLMTVISLLSARFYPLLMTSSYCVCFPFMCTSSVDSSTTTTTRKRKMQWIFHRKGKKTIHNVKSLPGPSTITQFLLCNSSKVCSILSQKQGKSERFTKGKQRTSSFICRVTRPLEDILQCPLAHTS